MRVAVALLSLVGLVGFAQDAPKETVEELVKKLGAEEYKTREEAAKKLEGMGAEVLPKLKEAREKTDDLETKSRLGDIISKLEKPAVEEEAPAKPKRGAAADPKQQLEKAKKILDQINKLMDDKDKEPEQKVKDLARLSRLLDQVFRTNSVTEWVGGAGGVKGQFRILRDPNGGFRIERPEDEKEPPPAEKTPKGGEEKKD